MIPGKDEVVPDGTFLIRRELIRLITNMCCGNKHHQDKVRIMGGVETILCHCVVDKQNPFMPQVNRYLSLSLSLFLFLSHLNIQLLLLLCYT